MKAQVWLTLVFLCNITVVFSQENELKLGLIAPFSGDATSYGQEAKNAITLALEDLEHQKLSHLFKVKIVFEDGACSGKTGLSAARKLIAFDKVHGIISAGCSSEVFGMAPAIQKAKIPLLAAIASHPDIAKAGDFIFRIAPNDLIGAKMAFELANDLGGRRIALINENTDYALGVEKVFVSLAKDKGLLIVANETFDSNLTDFRTLLIRIKSSKPDTIFVNPNSGQAAGIIVRQARELGFKANLIGHYMFSSADFRASAVNAGYYEGATFSDAAAIDTSVGKDLLERYRKQFGETQFDFLVAATYDIVMLFVAAWSVDQSSEGIRNYWLNLPLYRGAVGDFRFDEDGDVVGIKLTKKIYQDGQIKPWRSQ